MQSSSRVRALLFTVIAPLACTDDSTTDDEVGDGSTDASESGTEGGEQGSDEGAETSSGGPSECAEDLWADLTDRYPDATSVGSCDGVAGAGEVVGSLMNMAGLTIDDGTGTQLAPCVEARCDATYVYIASNGLMHYDFVQTTPNALVPTNFIFRLPLEPSSPSGDADVHAEVLGCVDGYNQFVANPDQGTNAEPSGLCLGTGNALLEFMVGGQSMTVAKLACLDTVAAMINGLPVFGPNEANMPDPWGSPVFAYPDVAGEEYVDPNNLQAGAALDLCGAHTGNSAHAHGVLEACYELDADNTPANSYASAASTFDFEAGLADTCTQESGIVGWSLDGHPIKGPCVCLARDDQGACTDVRRARSSWAYLGLSSWASEPGADPDSQGQLDLEGTACAEDSDCCPGGTCNLTCAYAVFDDANAPSGTTVDERCVVLDYSWCSHRYVDRGGEQASEFVYLDPCNGYEGPDGYAYHSTLSFPYVQACYRDQPSDSAGGTAGGGMMMGGDGDGDGDCMPGQTSMCCGDGVCDGPETAQSCAGDCA
ncbi:YHYH protein [Nannocystaceae bacterium ST9]